jgi:tRNA 5-methylaminomethyl-2-thiouridine biosynthesis bifunctional protein
MEGPRPPLRSAAPRIAIVGAGIAGAALARAFRRLGAEAAVVEAAAPGAGASGAPAALVMPRLDAGGGAVAELHAQAFDRSVGLYRREVPGSVIAEGALQLEAQPRDAARFGKLAAWPGFAPGGLARLDGPAAARALDEAAAPGALALPNALVVEPEAILAAWLEGSPVVVAAVARVERADTGWRLVAADGGTVLEADVLCLAAGPQSARLADLPLRAVRGQLSWSEETAFTGTAAAWGGYAVPLRRGVLFGATHERDDWGEDRREADDRRNLAELAEGRPNLAARIAPQTLRSRAAVRAAAPDHLPLAGALAGAQGLYVLSGLGGRGFTLAPLLAEHVAAMATGAPSPLPERLAAVVDPARFAGRNRNAV